MMTLFWHFLAGYCGSSLAVMIRFRYGERAEIMALTACCVAVALSGAPAALYDALGLLTSYMLIRWLVFR
jgi:hypothetical protein